MSAYSLAMLDIDEVAAGHPVALADLANLRADLARAQARAGRMEAALRFVWEVCGHRSSVPLADCDPCSTRIETALADAGDGYVVLTLAEAQRLDFIISTGPIEPSHENNVGEALAILRKRGGA